ncbi:MAG: hypothetical protein PHO01_09090 [Desulfotomaculaceae bacterium]|nr:hypothetical protein [Desulfotomaculaceae bacterium]
MRAAPIFLSGRKVMFFIRLLIFIFVILAILPVVDLPLATAVPVYVWLLLAVFDLLLIIVWRRRKKTKVASGPVLAGFIIVAALAVAASQFYAVE